jgi:hypothetical protein
MIDKSTGLNKKDKRPAANSLRKLASGWSEKDAMEFLKSIKLFEQIDEELWM